MAHAFSVDEKKKRAIKRLAEIFYDHWEEGRVGSTRIFEHVIPDEWLIKGQSRSGGSYREHVVPCALIRDQSINMYENGKTVAEVSSMIEQHLMIILISNAERDKLDFELRLKTGMPDGWTFETGDPLARLKAAGIELQT